MFVYALRFFGLAQAFEEDALPIGAKSMRRKRAIVADDFAGVIQAVADNVQADLMLKEGQDESQFDQIAKAELEMLSKTRQLRKPERRGANDRSVIFSMRVAAKPARNVSRSCLEQTRSLGGRVIANADRNDLSAAQTLLRGQTLCMDRKYTIGWDVKRRGLSARPEPVVDDLLDRPPTPFGDRRARYPPVGDRPQHRVAIS